MISRARPLPIDIAEPSDYVLPDEAVEIIAALLLDAVDGIEEETKSPVDGRPGESRKR